MTISSTNYGSVKTPVSSSTPIVARVTESLYPGEIQVVIRLKPEFVLDDPLRDYFRLEYDPNFEGYVLFQEDPGGTGSGRGVVMERGPSRIAATLTGFQYSERGAVQSEYTIKVVLTRVGP